MTLRLAFMGSPDFAVPTLEAIISAGHDVACVYSQPPRPAGRGKELRQTAVHVAAAKHGIDVRTPLNFKAQDDRDAFAALQLDVAVVVAYGLLLPKAILDAPRLGCFNLHGSILPRWRGAAPIHRAVMAGDTLTGVQVMRMEIGLDTGPVMLTATTPISESDTTGDVHDRLSVLGAGLMVEALAALEAGPIVLEQQSSDGVTKRGSTGRCRGSRLLRAFGACRHFRARGSSWTDSASRCCTRLLIQAQASPVQRWTMR